MKKSKIAYIVFYSCSAFIILCISLFSNVNFAYEFFDHLIFRVLRFGLIAAMLSVRSVQAYSRQTTFFGKLFCLVYYNMYAVVFACRLFLGNRAWAFLLLLAFLVALALLILLAFCYVKSPSSYNITFVEPIITALPVIILLVISITLDYVGGQGMWIPIVVIGIVLSAAALFLFVKYFKSIPYFKSSKGELFAALFMIVAIAFYISSVSITTINYSFDTVATPKNVCIVDKRVDSGARQITSFYLIVEVDGEQREIDVPIEIYHSKDVGENLDICLYNGALGYSYYVFQQYN